MVIGYTGESFDVWERWLAYVLVNDNKPMLGLEFIRYIQNNRLSVLFLLTRWIQICGWLWTTIA